MSQVSIVASKGDKVTVVKGAERITVTATEIWAAFSERSFTVSCIRCYDRGGQCTRNYPAGCKGNR